MLAVMLLSQHRVSSFKTVRPCAPCGARCIGHAIRTWSAVCLAAPHLRFGEGATVLLEYDVRGQLLAAIKLLYKQLEVCVNGMKTKPFSVSVGLRQGCVLLFCSLYTWTR